MKRLPLLVALVAFLLSNVYTQSLSKDAAAFQDGTAPKFSTKGHSKSKEAVFTIKYPPSWKALEGDRPNVVQKFVGKSDKGSATAMILTRSVPPNERFTQADVRAALSPEGLKEFLPSGAKLLSLKSTKIEREAAGLIELSMREERAGAEVDIQMLVLVFFQGRTLVSLQFSVGALSSDSADLPSRFEEFRPIFNLMTNSIVFDDKWSGSKLLQRSSHEKTFTASTDSWARREITDIGVSIDLPGEPRPKEITLPPQAKEMVKSFKSYECKTGGLTIGLNHAVYADHIMANPEGSAKGAVENLRGLDGVTNLQYSLNPQGKDRVSANGSFSRYGRIVDISALVITSDNKMWSILGFHERSDTNAAIASKRILDSLLVKSLDNGSRW